MQTCRGCRRRALMLRINRLITVFVLQLMRNVGGQGHFSQLLQNIFKHALIFKFDNTIAAFDDL